MSCMTEAWSWRRLTIYGRTTVSIDYCTVSIKETSPFTTGEKLYLWGGRRMYQLRKYSKFQMIEAIRINSNWRNALFDPFSLKCREHYCDFDRATTGAFRRGDLLANRKGKWKYDYRRSIKVVISIKSLRSACSMIARAHTHTHIFFLFLSFTHSFSFSLFHFTF